MVELLNKREMAMAKELARKLVIAEREKEIAIKREARERQRKALQESAEALGRVAHNVQKAYVRAFVKPINEAKKAIARGYLG